MYMKRWFIHYFDRNEKKWKKIFRMCLTYAEASYNIRLLEQGSKLNGEDVFYRIQCITIKPKSIKQLELSL